MSSLASVVNQNASTLVCMRFICEKCGIIDTDMDRMRAGHECAECRNVSVSARLALPIAIHILVDLVQQAYHSRSQELPDGSPHVSGVGTVLFFCSLREALLNWLMGGHLMAQRVPERLQRRLLDDNKLASQKFGNLFESVTGDKWGVAVARASSVEGVDLSQVSDLMKEAAEVRNEFLHQGTGWSADDVLATKCINAVPELVTLFCCLHRVYVRPMLCATA